MSTSLSNVDHQDLEAIKAELLKVKPVLVCNVLVLLKDMEERIKALEAKP